MESMFELLGLHPALQVRGANDCLPAQQAWVGACGAGPAARAAGGWHAGEGEGWRGGPAVQLLPRGLDEFELLGPQGGASLQPKRGCFLPVGPPQDKPGARALQPTDHSIAFHDVCFQVGVRMACSRCLIKSHEPLSGSVDGKVVK